MKPSEICEGAADLIESNGWCKSEFKNDDGQLCMLGALIIAQGLDIYGEDTMQSYIEMSAGLVLQAILDRAIRDGQSWVNTLSSVRKKWSTVASFNDCIAKNKEDVIDVLMDSAKKWRDQGE